MDRGGAVDLGALGRANPLPPADTFTAVVVRADTSGLWVVEEGGDPRTPVGPCRGGWTANGTRVPVGALVALTYTETEPWVIGFDNPALAINDATFAPFHNPSFELEDPGSNTGAEGWGYFGLGGDTSTREVITAGGAAHGQRHMRVTQSGVGNAFLQSTPWTVVAGSSLEITYYARRVAGAPRVSPYVFSVPPGMGEPGLFNPNAVTTLAAVHRPPVGVGEWLRYRATVSPPPTHTRLAALIRVDSDDGNPIVVELDNIDADLVAIDPTSAHQELMRRVGLVLAGGGTRTVTAGGNVSWTQPFTIAGIGFRVDEAPGGRFEISQPPNGTVIPVHSSAARTSHTVAGGVIALNPEDALYYELPLGDVAASQPARFHILGSTSADGFVPPPHWVLVVARSAWSAAAFALEYRWGDNRGQDPWRTPSFAAGWSAGTIPPRFTKTQSGLVVMRGRVAGGTGPAFTLPDGYFPTVAAHDDIVRDGAGAPAVLTVSTTGAVTTAGNATDHSIATTFPVLGG